MALILLHVKGGTGAWSDKGVVFKDRWNLKGMQRPVYKHLPI